MSYQEERLKRKNGLLPPLPTKKEKKPIPKMSVKKKKELVEKKDENGDTELVRWYRAKMKVMGDRCYWCGMKVENKIYSHAIFSICHILDKRDTKCPSLKTHPLNWVTLCPDHHTMFDAMNWQDRLELPFADTIKERLIAMYPDCYPTERRHFPESVRNYIEKNSFPQ